MWTLIIDGIHYLEAGSQTDNTYVISSKWVFVKIYKESKFAEPAMHCKVCFDGSGFLRIENADLLETLSLKVEHISVKLILFVAAAKDLDSHQTNAKKAF